MTEEKAAEKASGKQSQQGPAETSAPVALIAGGVGGLVVLGVIVLLMFGGGSSRPKPSDDRAAKSGDKGKTKTVAKVETPAQPNNQPIRQPINQPEQAPQPSAVSLAPKPATDGLGNVWVFWEDGSAGHGPHHRPAAGHSRKRRRTGQAADHIVGQ